MSTISITKNDIESFLTKTGKIDSTKIKCIEIPDTYMFCKSKTEYLYCVLNDITEQVLCTVCNINPVRFKTFSSGYSCGCSSKCRNSNPITRRKNSESLKKFFENPGNLLDLSNRVKSKSHEEKQIIEQKKRKTKLERYGSETYNNPELSMKTKCQNGTMPSSFDVIDKTKMTKFNRYGDENYNNSVLQKKTCLELYGFENYFQTDHVRSIVISRRKDVDEQFNYYAREVRKFTNRVAFLLENFSKRGMAGVAGAYHIDHKISIKYGYDHNIPTSIIGHLQNLIMIPWKENYSKGTSCSISIHELMENIKKENNEKTRNTSINT